MIRPNYTKYTELGAFNDDWGAITECWRQPLYYWIWWKLVCLCVHGNTLYDILHRTFQEIQLLFSLMFSSTDIISTLSSSLLLAVYLKHNYCSSSSSVASGGHDKYKQTISWNIYILHTFFKTLLSTLNFHSCNGFCTCWTVFFI